MGSKRFLFTFGLGGGLAAGAVIAAVLRLLDTSDPLATWAVTVGTSMVAFTLGGYLTWFQWASRRARHRRTLVSALGGLQRDLDPRIIDVHVVRLMVALGAGSPVTVERSHDREGYRLRRVSSPGCL